MSKTAPHITVIIPHYNEFLLTKQCILSVSKSRYEHFDILVVDNGSTNNSSIKLEEYCRNKKVSYIKSKTNRYFAGGCNLGAKHAKGTYIVFLNNDTEVHPDWISELVAGMDDQTDVFIQPQVLFEDRKRIVDNRGGRYTWWGSGYGIGRNKPMMRVTSRSIDYTVGTACMMNRLLFLKLGGFDEWFRGYYEDVDLSLRLKNMGGECRVCYNSLVYHKGSATYRKHVSPSDHLLDIRKNRLRTIIKNFRGIELYARMTAALISYLALLVLDIRQSHTTIQAVYYAMRPDTFRHKI